jgi:hypothetical protein
MTQRVTPPTGDSKRYPEPEQVDRLIGTAPTPRDKAFISTLVKTGMRSGQHKQVRGWVFPQLINTTITVRGA